jgi:hypothetical protein
MSIDQYLYFWSHSFQTHSALTYCDSNSLGTWWVIHAPLGHSLNTYSLNIWKHTCLLDVFLSNRNVTHISFSIYLSKGSDYFEVSANWLNREPTFVLRFIYWYCYIMISWGWTISWTTIVSNHSFKLLKQTYICKRHGSHVIEKTGCREYATAQGKIKHEIFLKRQGFCWSVSL